MTASRHSLTAKQQVLQIALLCVLLMPMVLIALFFRNSYLGQHFGALAFGTVMASLLVNISVRTWIPKVK